MSRAEPIDFWFSIGSLYTYLSVMRIDRVEDASDITFRWRPFSVRAIMIEMDNRPMSKPVKLAYMTRDLKRRAHMLMCDFSAEPPYPLKDFDLINRVATVAAAEGWCDDFTRTAYSRWFGEGQEVSTEPYLTATLRDIGQDPVRVLSLATSDTTGRAYDAATDEARQLGVFGAPTFVTRGELFWGDDRLEDAVRWHRHGTLRL